MNLAALAMRYSAFAVIATVANLGAQRAILSLGHGIVFYAAAVGTGTLVGLAIKYLLDRKWIFFDVERDLEQHSHTFGLYSAMGVVTTAIFWGTETAFWYLGRTGTARELGAIIGLAIGYVVKYHLDRRFVFTDKALGGGCPDGDDT
jgi:putative flippase GtrA